MNIKALGKASEKRIQDLEKYLGFQLPEDYKEFLREVNGGTSKVRYSHFFVKELNQDIPLDVLYGIGVKSAFDLKKWYEEFEEDLLPKSLIIGDNPGSGLIVLITSENSGIYYWDHSFYFPQSNEGKNTYKIADSFTDFIYELKNP